jgi:hypothetical protein
VLAWHQAGREAALRATFWGLVLVAISVISWLDGLGPLYWVRWWEVWLIIVSGVGAMALTLESERCSAGADWLRHRKSWVRTYELTVISVRYRS